MEEAETVFANSHRQYENVRYTDDILDYGAAFWTRVGPTLRKLEINGRGTSQVFLSILQACSSLNSLKINMCGERGELFELSELPPATNLESIKKSMFNLRHLHLADYATNIDTLERLFILMPNVSSVAFTWSYVGSYLLSRSLNMLGASRSLTILNLYLDYFSNDECEQLFRMWSASLRTLSISGDIFVPRVLDALRNCSMLRDLTLECLYNRRLLPNILRNVPELESLSIRNLGSQEEAFRQEDLMEIFNLRKLRELHLDCELVAGLDACVPVEIVRDLSRMISLQSLTLGDKLSVVDSTRFRILASMPNLRELVIHRIHWNAKCLRTVLFDLGKLTKLEIRGHLPSRDWESFLRDQHSELERNILTTQDSDSSDRQGGNKISSLEILRISGIPLCDACLSRISSHHNRLKVVWLPHCNDITNAGLVTLFQREPLLEKLFVYSENLDGTLFEGLGELCRRLRLLIVLTQGNISEQAEEEFKLRRPRVKCRFS